MDAKQLAMENERLRKLLSEVQASHQQVQAQHQAVIEQFVQTVKPQQRQVSALEHQITLLMQRIKGSRQERINPDQLLLFSVEELQQIADELKQGDPQDDLIETPPKNGRKQRSRGRVGKLPSHLLREVVRHELADEDRKCPCCGELRHECGMETSEQLELIPAQLKDRKSVV